MIIEHRKNNYLDWSTNIAAEFDVRLTTGIVSDPCLLISHDHQESIYNNLLSTQVLNNVELPYFSIVNIKTSGAEEKAIELFHSVGYQNYYFLDSQIPDIVRLSKTKNIGHKFIIRVSDIESFNDNLFSLTKAKYLWLDWTKYDIFNQEEYTNFVETTFESAKRHNVRVIVVSPELYNIEYVKLIDDMKRSLRKFDFDVCTKLKDKWEDLC